MRDQFRTKFIQQEKATCCKVHRLKRVLLAVVEEYEQSEISTCLRSPTLYVAVKAASESYPFQSTEGKLLSLAPLEKQEAELSSRKTLEEAEGALSGSCPTTGVS